MNPFLQHHEAFSFHHISHLWFAPYGRAKQQRVAKARFRRCLYAHRHTANSFARQPEPHGPAVCRQLVIETLPWQMPVEIGGYGFDGCAPFASGVYGSGWRLHKGLNAQFSLSVSAGLGKHAPKGVGFGQSAAFAYVLPLNSRFSIAAGIYAANMNWGSWRQTDVGFAGVLAYRVNENINLYAYGSKTFMPRNNPFAFRHDPFPVFYDRPRDRIGAAAEFKIGNNAVIGVSVEHRSY